MAEAMVTADTVSQHCCQDIAIGDLTIGGSVSIVVKILVIWWIVLN